MLQLKIKESNEIDQTGKLVYITDATGNFSLSNATGYGGPNDERDVYAIFCMGFLVDSKGVKTPLSFTAYDPRVASEFVAKIPKDGRLQFQLFALPLYATLDPADLTLPTYVFSVEDFSPMKVVFDEETELNTFVPISREEAFAVATNLVSIPYEELFIANSTLTQINVNKQITDLRISNESQSNKEKIKELKEQYDTIRGVLQSAIYQFCIGNKYEASRYIEFLITNRYGKL